MFSENGTESLPDAGGDAPVICGSRESAQGVLNNLTFIDEQEEAKVLELIDVPSGPVDVKVPCIVS